MADNGMVERDADRHESIVAMLRRFVSIWEWNHDDASDARREYDRAAAEAAALLEEIPPAGDLREYMAMAVDFYDTEGNGCDPEWVKAFRGALTPTKDR